MTDNQWEALTERIAIMQNEGNMTASAAIIEAVKTMFPTDYSEIVKTCNEMRLKPEIEIPDFIIKLEAERKTKPEISGYDKMAAYAQGAA